MEKSIKEKIEALGTPLKDWDVKIYRGILTGYNEAFIIDGKKRAELIAKDPKSEEIIRPILKDTMIGFYKINHQDKYLINLHNGIKAKGIPPIIINDYPDIKNHIDQVVQLVCSGSLSRRGGHTNRNSSFFNRADQGITPYNLRDCAYLESFDCPKLVWKQTSINRTFALDIGGHFLDVSGQMLTVNNNDVDLLRYILGFLNSNILNFYMKFSSSKFGESGTRWIPSFTELLPIIRTNKEHIKEISNLVDHIIILKSDFTNSIVLEKFKQIEYLLFSLYGFNNVEIEIVDKYKNMIIFNI